MAPMSLTTYLQTVKNCWMACDGEALAKLLSARDEHVQYPLLNIEAPEPLVRKFLAPPVDRVISTHLRIVRCFRMQYYIRAYNHQLYVLKYLIKIITELCKENWSLPLLHAACIDLRLMAQNCSKLRQDLSGSIMNNTLKVLMACFRICAADSESFENTKRIGMMAIANQLFKVYFPRREINLCQPLINEIESSTIKNRFPLGQQITYKFYVSRKAILEYNFELAHEYLTFAFENCPKDCIKNKRLILMYLIPVKMSHGYMPSKSILEKYNFFEYSELIPALRAGNLLIFDQILRRYETLFVESGLYILVKNLKLIGYRNLFRKVSLILNTHQIPIEALERALLFVGQRDVHYCETERIVQNLICNGQIRGHIAHQHRKLVLCKENPFPPLTGSI